MKVIVITPDAATLRISAGEELVDSLKAFTAEHGIVGAHFSGLGACRETELSWYDLSAKKYVTQKFEEEMEIVSLTGNIGQLDGQPAIHAHGVFGTRDFQVIGGHVQRLVVSATLELSLTVLPQPLRRMPDETVGLNLLQ